VEYSDFVDVALHQQLEQFTADFEPAFDRAEIVIPVVVHVVYQTEAENISDEQIFSQIEVLNRDFNRKQLNIHRIPSQFQDRIANVGFEFCLAQTDPSGQSTTGITRTATEEENVFTRQTPWIYYTDMGGQDAWDTERYLNIWVTKTGRLFAAFASKPGQNLPAEDGVVIDPLYFGMEGTALAPFDKGKTLTHEVGHYFNLFHPWNGGCDGDDFVEDTPNQDQSYVGCPLLTARSCGTLDLVANFMNNSEDDCLAMFTDGQAERMRAALMGARKKLLDNQVCTVVKPPEPNFLFKVFPNPTTAFFNLTTGNIPRSPYQVIDLHGRVLRKGILVANAEVIVAGLNPGLYFLSIYIEAKDPISQKIIVY
jgi:hypothetical protein